MTRQFVDIYCERTAAGLWQEPFNVFTNLAFIAVALWLSRKLVAGQLVRRTWDVQTLVALVAAIGIGSGLWHLLAIRWAELADVIPIALFINLYLGSFLYRILALGPLAVALGIMGFQMLGLLVAQSRPPDTWNGSIAYLPAYATLTLLTAVTWRCSPAMRNPLRYALALFTVSMVARSIDNLACPYVTTGTHFIWHLLNAEVLRQLVLALIHAQVARPLKPRTLS
jgi:hypothetical protein